MSEPKYLAMRLKIVGKEWTVYFCSKRYFDKKHREYFEAPPGPAGNGTLAFTCQDDKKLFLRSNRMRRETIIHELCHSYLWELCLWDLRHRESDATPERIEEAFCDLLSKYGKKLLKQTDQIIEAYEILKGKVS